MPRPLERGTPVTFGASTVLERPDLAAALGAIASTWAVVEIHLSGFLAELASTNHKAALAILARIPTAKARSETIREIGRMTMPEDQFNALKRLLALFNAGAKERNDVIHGVWGVAPSEPAALIWMHPKDYVEWHRSHAARLLAGELDSDPMKSHPPFTVYLSTDLEAILERLNSLLSEIVRLTAAVNLFRRSGGTIPFRVTVGS